MRAVQAAGYAWGGSIAPCESVLEQGLYEDVLIIEKKHGGGGVSGLASAGELFVCGGHRE
jgi:hypothetical protein